MIEQCLEMQEALHEEGDEEDDSEYDCPHCGVLAKVSTTVRLAAYAVVKEFVLNDAP